MEEVEGFEPPRGVTRLSVFKTDPFSRTWVYLRDFLYSLLVALLELESMTSGYNRLLNPIELQIF